MIFFKMWDNVQAPPWAKTMAGWLFICYLIIGGTIQYKELGILQILVSTQTSLYIDEKLLRDVADAERFQRGFVITAQDKMLTHYFKSMKDAQEDLQTVQELHRNDGEHALAEDLARQVHAKIGEMSDVIKIRQSQGFEQTANYIEKGKGVDLMERIEELSRLLRVKQQVKQARAGLSISR